MIKHNDFGSLWSEYPVDVSTKLQNKQLKYLLNLKKKSKSEINPKDDSKFLILNKTWNKMYYYPIKPACSYLLAELKKHIYDERVSKKVNQIMPCFYHILSKKGDIFI